MRNQQTGAVICRAAGVVLMVIAGSSLLSWPMFEPSGFATSGWTSYSPLATNVSVASSMTERLNDTYYAAFHSPRFWLPSAVQGAVGLIMILFSRGIGRWLAGGLSDGDSPPTA